MVQTYFPVIMPTPIPVDQFLRVFGALEAAHDEITLNKKRGAKLDDLIKEVLGKVRSMFNLF
jgi:hypothetical protein